MDLHFSPFLRELREFLGHTISYVTGSDRGVQPAAYPVETLDTPSKPATLATGTLLVNRKHRAGATCAHNWHVFSPGDISTSSHGV